MQYYNNSVANVRTPDMRRRSMLAAVALVVLAFQMTTSAARATPLFAAGIACIAGSNAGVSCWDGKSWRLYTMANSPLGSNLINDMAVCQDGKLWMVYSSGLSATDGEHWITYKGVFPASPLEALACNPEGGVWLAYPSGLAYFNGGGLKLLENEKLRGDAGILTIKDVAVGSDGRAWLAGETGLATYDGKDWTVANGEAFFVKPYSTRKIAVDNRGDAWLVHDNGIIKFSRGKWLPKESHPLEHVVDVAVDSSGYLWAPRIVEGVSKYDGTSWITFDRTNSGLSSDNVRSVSIDGRGRAWIGTRWGLNVYDGQRWHAYHVHNAGLAGNDVNAIVVTGEGPPLPPLVTKRSGSVSGRILQAGKPFAGASVQACVESLMFLFSGPTPCAKQPFHRSTTTDANGRFTFPNLPAGSYHLAVMTAATGWRALTARYLIGATWFQGVGSTDIRVDPGRTLSWTRLT